jgi:predicted enzyme related to lactoylglutathione lyase
MQITEIAFTGTPVTDIKRARKFYEEVLGLRPTLEVLNGMLVEYEIGNGVFTIGCLGDAFQPSSDGTFVSLEVENLDDAVARLNDCGVQFVMGVTELPTSKFVVVSDPDGNNVMIHKRKG